MEMEGKVLAGVGEHTAGVGIHCQGGYEKSERRKEYREGTEDRGPGLWVPVHECQ